MVTREFSSLWEKTLLKSGSLQQLKAKKHPVFKGFDTSDCIAFGQGFPTGGVILATKTRGVWRAQGNVQ